MNNQFEALQELIRDFIHRREWERFHTPKNLAMSISIEAAELMELFQWSTIKEGIENLKDKQFLNNVEDEIADIMIYSLSFASITNINLEEVIRKKLSKNETRFPEVIK